MLLANGSFGEYFSGQTDEPVIEVIDLERLPSGNRLQRDCPKADIRFKKVVSVRKGEIYLAAKQFRGHGSTSAWQPTKTYFCLATERRDLLKIAESPGA